MKAPLQIMFGQFSAGMRMADLLDIALIGVLVYVSLEWFRRRGSRSLAVGAGVCVLLYLAADRLDMVLTSMLFQVGFTAVLLALIVVFQHDIRRAFERMAAWSVITGKDHVDSTTRELDALSECLAALAQNRIGALLVFVGRESITIALHRRLGAGASPGSLGIFQEKCSRSDWLARCGCCSPTDPRPSSGRTSYRLNTVMFPRTM